MIEEVVESIFRVKVPLPRNPLRHVNSYFLADKKRWLVIDTGMNLDECYKALISAIRKFKLRNPLYIATHNHADHIGVSGRLSDSLLMSSIDAGIVESITEDRWVEVARFYVKNGFPKEMAELMLRLHPARNIFVKEIERLEDGDEIEFGEFSLRCILTPGHTPGHLCLYDDERKILFSGDHILFDITPNIAWWPFMNALDGYLRSLDKIYSLKVKTVLPGHRGFSGELRNRIDELKDHHKRRLEEALAALDSPKTAWEVAPSISWDLEFSNWDGIPLLQKWFIVGETIAHLEYLFGKGRVDRLEKDGRIYYI
jgi:glyoxylase-like metal-dependent hydrolase (beta-lactamase superfamily II)